MFQQVLIHTPLWVWALPAALLALGLSQRRDRRVHRAQVLALPGLHPEWRAMASVQWPLALLFGALSGFFLGRALGLMRLAQPTIPRHAHA